MVFFYILKKFKYLKLKQELTIDTTYDPRQFSSDYTNRLLKQVAFIYTVGRGPFKFQKNYQRPKTEAICRIWYYFWPTYIVSLDSKGGHPLFFP